ncbi:MAG TPA: hypothetical protein VGL66_19275 [Caulobacteraceae bacterium]
MRRKPKDQVRPPTDPIEAAVRAGRLLTGTADEEWPDDLRDIGPRPKDTPASSRKKKAKGS